MIKPYLSDIINDNKTRGLVRYHSGNKAWEEETSSEWKIQLTMTINFISSKDSDETLTMHTKSNNAEIMMGSKIIHNNPEKSSTTKINKHIPSGYLLFTQCSFDATKSKLDYYRGKTCMENFCLDLREHVTKIINYEKKEMIPLTK